MPLPLFVRYHFYCAVERFSLGWGEQPGALQGEAVALKKGDLVFEDVNDDLRLMWFSEDIWSGKVNELGELLLILGPQVRM